jgi:hypothetical protein
MPVLNPISPELDSSIKHLGNLLQHLPASIPLVNNIQESSYDLNLDGNDVADEGLGFAFNRCMEIAFSMHRSHLSGTVDIRERGEGIMGVVTLLRQTVKKFDIKDRKLYLERWILRLIQGVKDAGAKIPNKRYVEFGIWHGNILIILWRHAVTSSPVDANRPIQKASPVVRLPSDSDLVEHNEIILISSSKSEDEGKKELQPSSESPALT